MVNEVKQSLSCGEQTDCFGLCPINVDGKKILIRKNQSDKHFSSLAEVKSKKKGGVK
jgi:hypothetical protein